MTALALEIRDLYASFGDLEILRGVDLDVPLGEVHVLMGPNGSGKSTLCHVLMGKDEYSAAGSAKVNGIEKDNYQHNSRFAATLAVPIKKQLFLRVFYINSVNTALGADFDVYNISLQYTWGGGL